MKNRLTDKGFILIASELGELEPYFAQVKAAPDDAGNQTLAWTLYMGVPCFFYMPSMDKRARWTQCVAMRITTHPCSQSHYTRG